ncbi:hypothetical protein PA07A_1713 [Cutibacterium acnes P07A]|nr:hypothetical protein [Cutibacterium acnes P07A]
MSQVISWNAEGKQQDTLRGVAPPLIPTAKSYGISRGLP